MNVGKIIVYGADWCGDCQRAKRFFKDFNIEYEWHDTDHDPQALEIVRHHNQGKRVIPTVVFEDGSILVEPSYQELADKLKITV